MLPSAQVLEAAWYAVTAVNYMLHGGLGLP